MLISENTYYSSEFFLREMPQREEMGEGRRGYDLFFHMKWVKMVAVSLMNLKKNDQNISWEEWRNRRKKKVNEG